MARSYKILERGAQNPLKWLLNAYFSHFLISLLQIFKQKDGWADPLDPSPKSATGGMDLVKNGLFINHNLL